MSLAWLIAALMIAVGLVVLIGRRVLARNAADSGASLVRSWIALAFVAGLMVFSAVALAIGDVTLRSTLFGGVVASVGAAVAFYFSSKDADQARKDMLNAVSALVVVPDLTNMTVLAARNLMSQTPLQLVVDPPNAADGATIKSQVPVVGTTLKSGSVLTASTK